MIKNLIFDLGGVLIDWNPRYLYQSIFTQSHEMEFFLKNICTHEWNAQLDTGRSFKEATQDLIRKFPRYSHEINLYWQEWGQMLKGEITPVVQLLHSLKFHSDFRLYVLSNWSLETFPIALKRFEFLKWFDGFIISGEEKIAKPDPEIYLRLLNRYQLKPSECLFIDDRLENIETALKLNFSTIHYQDPQSLLEQLQSLGLISNKSGVYQ